LFSQAAGETGEELLREPGVVEQGVEGGVHIFMAAALARGVFSLASERARYVNGVTLAVDGGLIRSLL
jgi:NAD(P)-dependent dehydrogenase (short-subunit alcohol dehydrogenase family)